MFGGQAHEAGREREDRARGRRESGLPPGGSGAAAPRRRPARGRRVDDPAIDRGVARRRAGDRRCDRRSSAVRRAGRPGRRGTARAAATSSGPRSRTETPFVERARGLRPHLTGEPDLPLGIGQGERGRSRRFAETGVLVAAGGGATGSAAPSVLPGCRQQATGLHLGGARLEGPDDEVEVLLGVGFRHEAGEALPDVNAVIAQMVEEQARQSLVAGKPEEQDRAEVFDACSELDTFRSRR